MSKEAMKLALEALEPLVRRAAPWGELDWLNGCKAISALREALAEPDFWEGYVPEPVKPAQCKYPKCSYPCTDLPDCRDAEQPAQQALDKKAENARELGLDYEPAQQEPVGWFNEDRGILCKDFEALGYGFEPACWEPLYTSPPAQRTWVGLSDAEIHNMTILMGFNPEWVPEVEMVKSIVRNLEAKLKEKNT